MTVTASPADVPPGTAFGTPQNVPGKGQSLLNVVADLQALVTAAANPAVQSALLQQLNMAQIEAVDYFMASYWVSADSILTQMTSLMVLPKQGDVYVKTQLAAIATRAAQVAVLVARGTPQPIYSGNWLQYSQGYPPPNSGYPLTEPDVYLYGLQTQLVDYCMNKAILPASLILSTMTGTQTYPWNGYESNYTWYQQYYMGASY